MLQKLLQAPFSSLLSTQVEGVQNHPLKSRACLMGSARPAKGQPGVKSPWHPALSRHMGSRLGTKPFRDNWLQGPGRCLPEQKSPFCPHLPSSFCVHVRGV